LIFHGADVVCRLNYSLTFFPVGGIESNRRDVRRSISQTRQNPSKLYILFKDPVNLPTSTRRDSTLPTWRSELIISSSIQDISTNLPLEPTWESTWTELSYNCEIAIAAIVFRIYYRNDSSAERSDIALGNKRTIYFAVRIEAASTSASIMPQRDR